MAEKKDNNALMRISNSFEISAPRAREKLEVHLENSENITHGIVVLWK